MARGVLWFLSHRGLSLLRYRALPAVGHQLMRHRSQNQVVSRWPDGEIPLGPRVCLYAHWDGSGEVRPHVLHHVRSLAATGMSVVFVTNAGSLRPASLEALKLVCAGVIVRRNVGYDFGAWREALEQVGLPRPNTAMVAITNDSVYGPLRTLDEMFGAIDFEVADAWAATDSWQGRYHLQSYFMVFSPAVLRSGAWGRFWAQVQPTWSKHWIIRVYELGLTQMLLKDGFRCRAIWPYKKLVKDIDSSLLDDKAEDGPNFSDPLVQARRRHVLRISEAITARLPLNPTSDLWRQLLAARYPFVKRELLRDNPTKVPDVAEWREVVTEMSEPALAAIEYDLQRTLRNRTP